MPDSDDDKKEVEIESFDGRKMTMSLLLKLGSGTILLAIIGYAASWAFVTLNALQDGVTKNTETLQMIKEDVNKDRENMAQWKRIAEHDRRITDNEVEIRVIKEMLDFYVDHAGKSPSKQEGENPNVYGPEKPHRLDDLFDEFIKKKKKKPIDPKSFKDDSIQQMEQRIVPSPNG